MNERAEQAHEDLRQQRLQLVGLTGLAGWAGLMVVIIGTLMVGHWVVLPTPSGAERPEVASALQGLARGHDGDWLVVHVMYAECRCSQRIVDHLIDRGRPAGVTEHVLLVGEDQELSAPLSDRGYTVTQLTAEQLSSRFHVQAAPLLLVAAPDGELRYAGGYTERKQGYRIRDVDILDTVMAKGWAAELPAFGCAVAEALQNLLDPLGVKYATTATVQQ